MKQIIALQEYTDKYISLYEGQIRNVENNLANQLIQQGIVAEHDESSGGNSGSGGGGCFFINATYSNDGTSFTTDKTFSEIKSAYESNQLIALNFSTNNNNGNEIYYLTGTSLYNSEVVVFIFDFTILTSEYDGDSDTSYSMLTHTQYQIMENNNYISRNFKQFS